MAFELKMQEAQFQPMFHFDRVIFVANPMVSQGGKMASSDPMVPPLSSGDSTSCPAARN